NPNPEDPNVPNEDVPEEDPYHLLDYDEEDPVEEPKPLPRHGDQFDAHPNLQPGNINDWVDDDDDDDDATIGTGSQRSFVVQDFPMGFYEAGESSTAREPQFVGGLAPWALRRDLEALRRHERIREA
nr:hypothetical protein [Tanacetum cinerariifolium]